MTSLVTLEFDLRETGAAFVSEQWIAPSGQPPHATGFCYGREFGSMAGKNHDQPALRVVIYVDGLIQGELPGNRRVWLSHPSLN